MRLLFALCLTMLIANAQAAKVGLVLPFEGRFSQTSTLIRDGVVQELSQAGENDQLIELNNDCDVEAVSQLAEKLSSVQFIIGPLCFNVAKALAVTLKTVPVITLDSRSPLLQRARDREKLPLYDLGKAHNAEADAFLDLIVPRFGGRPFALIDDGSVHGRSLADAIRLKGQERGLIPVATDTFRPFQTNQRTLLRRLNKSGVKAVLIAGGPEDVETIASDMRALGLDWKIAAGDQAALLPFTAKSDLPDDLTLLRESLPDNLEDTASNKLMLMGKTAVQLGMHIAKNSLTNDGAPSMVSTVLGGLKLDSSGIVQTFPYKAVTWRSLVPARVESD